MPLRILVIPDKFKGTLSAPEAARAIADGWRKARPGDRVDALPMSDGGEGFGASMALTLGAETQRVATLDAAHRSLNASWHWAKASRAAVIESAAVVGLSLLPPGRFHPFQLDTFGLARVLRAAAARGAERILVGLGGSATNDAGFGLARGLGWSFRDKKGRLLREWWELSELASIRPPAAATIPGVIAVVDVNNVLLGPTGASSVFGPQKGLRDQDAPHAETCLRQLARVYRGQFDADPATVSGSGAAGGLGFGLLAFAGAEMESGFNVFAAAVELRERLIGADLVITGEGAIDRQTAMGKGVGQLARMCRLRRIPCMALAGAITDRMGDSLFTQTLAAASVAESMRSPAKTLAALAEKAARSWRAK